MRLACFSSALLTMVHKHQAAAVQLEDPTGLQDKAEPTAFSPTWLNQEDSESEDWTQLVQRGIEAATQEAAQIRTETNTLGESVSTQDNSTIAMSKPTSLVQLFQDNMSKKDEMAAQTDSLTHTDGENIGDHMNAAKTVDENILNASLERSIRGAGHTSPKVTTQPGSVVLTTPNCSETGTG